MSAVVGPAREFVAARGILEDAPAELLARTLMAWTTLFGTVSFEIFGHLVGSVADPERWYDAVVLRLAADLGIPRVADQAVAAGKADENRP